ncbi:MAG: alkaline phosphatase [Salinivirgaceae bacterium]|nr:alkaline phosphatase [Salinivirgaceae bacterium]
MKKSLFYTLLIIFIAFSGCNTQPTSQHPKYVFLFIGDGMGLNQVQISELYLAAIADKYEPEDLSFSNFPIQSYQTTYSVNSLITCSSAAVTALATGYKTNNGVLGKDTSLTINYETIAEKAKKAGYKIGVLSSVAIDHATPAGFYAHQNYRGMYYEISTELPKSEFDYFGGGAFHYPTGKDLTKANAYELAESMGYTITDTQEEFFNIKQGDEKVLAFNPELYPDGEFYWEIDKKPGSISLADFTEKGIEVLENEKGFFMMVEGGKIDWACHSNDAVTMIHETLAFSDAVAEAIEFYQEHPNETLILVTADHETGGIVLGNGASPKLGVLENQKISGQEFIRKLTNLKNENKNVSFKQVMDSVSKDFGLGKSELGLSLTKEEKEFLYEGYQVTFSNNLKGEADKDYLSEKEGNSFAERVVYLLNEKAGISWSSYNHSATSVPIYAIGAGQEQFKTKIDNTDIPKIIAELMGL